MRFWLYFCALSLLSLCADLKSAQAACAEGRQVCVETCVCLPDWGPQADAWLKSAKQAAAQGLFDWLQVSREQILRTHPREIPLDIRLRLQPYFSDDLLMAARYSTAPLDVSNVATAMLYNPDTQAVTLLDVIVFRQEQDAQESLELWAHELVHVQQYQTWGAEGFAQRYTENYQEVEAPAYAMQARVRVALRDGRISPLN